MTNAKIDNSDIFQDKVLSEDLWNEIIASESQIFADVILKAGTVNK